MRSRIKFLIKIKNKGIQNGIVSGYTKHQAPKANHNFFSSNENFTVLWNVQGWKYSKIFALQIYPCCWLFFFFLDVPLIRKWELHCCFFQKVNNNSNHLEQHLNIIGIDIIMVNRKKQLYLEQLKYVTMPLMNRIFFIVTYDWTHKEFISGA